MSQPHYITLGGKSPPLTPSSLFSIATSTTCVRIDSSSSSLLSPNPNPNNPDNPNNPNPNLSLEESRASLTVLLTRLLPRNPTLSLRISTLLNNATSSADNATSHCDDDVAVVVGVCGLIDFKVESLARIVDVVAALSCEAGRIGVKGAFERVDSGDGGVDRDEVGVASDMSVLLNNSKLIDKARDSEKGVREIVAVHGGFRGAGKFFHSKVRVWLNGGDAENNVLSVLFSLARSVLALGKSSLCRVRMNLEKSGLVEMFGERGLSCDGLNGRWRKALDAESEEDVVGFVHEVYVLVGMVWEVVTWEAITAFVVLEGVEGDEKKGDKKSDKKKKKKALGNGTEVVVQLIKDRLEKSVAGDGVDGSVLLQSRVAGIYSLLDPKDAEFDSLLEKLKEIVDSNASRRLPKLPKGTRDFGKEEMAIRKKAFSIIEGVFERHGATALDTPVFEMRETLMGKYGEDSKLIYDLANQGGELCSLRYDLTVPFARYVAMHGITALKRYQIAKVYRRDNPSKGRYREFYQCDFDIAGQYERMGPDFEVVKILTELLDELDIGDYEIKLNHRKLLDGMLEICGVPPEKFRTICSSIDKLDKQPFEKVKKEMVEEKGLSNETADKIGDFVKERGSPLELLSKLKQEGSKFLENDGSVLALNDLEILFKALDKSKCVNKVVFDLSLARGLDYYTGVIFEAAFKGVTQVGSIAAGGRYDNLIGMFGSKQVPSVGVSLGIERVFAIMEQLQKEKNETIRPTKTQVLVSILGDDISRAAELASEFWNAKLETEFMVNKRVNKHIDRALESRIPWMVLVGDREFNAGVVRLKNIEANQEEEVPRSQIVEELKKRLNC